ncbi:MAG: diaminopimelate epimerase [Flavobacteriales bacterium]
MVNAAATAIFAVVGEQRLAFSKWEGTGNDFIVVDDRLGTFPVHDIPFVRQLCDRHFGVGSDGMILLQLSKQAGTDYHMEFFNPDGSKSFCGNGSRCAFAFQSMLLHTKTPVQFSAIDGVHSASWQQDDVAIGMRDVGSVEHIDVNTDFIHTGSPHLLCWVDDPEAIDIVQAAHVHRYGARFRTEGVNVNFLRWASGCIEMRTYERGVEAETLSCGTGVTAAALGAMALGHVSGICQVRTRGGDLRVEATKVGEGFTGISLIGPVRHVFNGEVNKPA